MALTDLEIEIATELAAFGTDLDGEQFWATVHRLATFGEDWVDHI